jgi:hypothetical protein
MELLIVVFVGGFVLYLIVKVVKSRSRSVDKDSSESLRGPLPQQNLRTYRIFTLGTSGAGKTCFMASMFHLLSSYKPDIGFYLEVPDHRQRLLLTNLYTEMTDPYHTWPGGTVNEKEWRFTSVVPSNGYDYPVFQFTYLDYAGGHLTDPSQGDLLDAQAKVAEADAVLVLLDGQKILRRLDNTEHLIADPKKRIGAELNFVLPYLTKSPKKPIHFVISKWDLLEGKYSIAQVRDCLLQYHNFMQIIAYRAHLRVPTRLIPVSAVGIGFATVSNDGSMKKSPSVNPKPFQVEMSIASTLIDAFVSATRDLSDQQLAQLRRFSSVQHMAKVKIVSALREAAGVMADVFREIMPFPWGVAPVAAVRLLGIIHDQFGRSYQDLEQEQRMALGQVKDQETAVHSVIASYRFLMRDLERKFPESTLY